MTYKVTSYLLNGKITEDTGWKDLKTCIKYRKKNEVVYICGQSRKQIDIAPEEFYSGGFLPAEYRPSHEIATIGTPMNYTGYEIQCVINSSTGEVKVGNLSPTKNTNYWGFILSYPTD